MATSFRVSVIDSPDRVSVIRFQSSTLSGKGRGPRRFQRLDDVDGRCPARSILVDRLSSSADEHHPLAAEDDSPQGRADLRLSRNIAELVADGFAALERPLIGGRFSTREAASASPVAWIRQPTAATRSDRTRLDSSSTRFCQPRGTHRRPSTTRRGMTGWPVTLKLRNSGRRSSNPSIPTRDCELRWDHARKDLTDNVAECDIDRQVMKRRTQPRIDEMTESFSQSPRNRTPLMRSCRSKADTGSAKNQPPSVSKRPPLCAQ
jgi:hypothetical protein